MRSRPTPGHEKIVSVTTAPVRSDPNCRPATTSTGRQRVAPGVAQNGAERPLAARDGGRDVGPVHLLPEAGPHHSRQESGESEGERDGREDDRAAPQDLPSGDGEQAEPDREHEDEDRPGDVVRRGDAEERGGTEGAVERPAARESCGRSRRDRNEQRAKKRREREFRRGRGQAARISSVTLRFVRIDDPRSPRAMFQSHEAYCARRGRSRPRSRLRPATSAGAAPSPSIAAAGSPGIRWMRKKTTVAAPRRSSGTSIRRRSGGTRGV